MRSAGFVAAAILAPCLIAASASVTAAAAAAAPPKGTAPAPSDPTAGQPCALEIAANDLMQFDRKELRVGANCGVVELTLRHTGRMPATAMGHNWVLVKDADATRVANDGLSAGVANGYVKPGDARVLAHSSVVGGGQSTTVRFPTTLLRKGEGYTYECTFPGHSAVMRGKLIFD